MRCQLIWRWVSPGSNSRRSSCNCNVSNLNRYLAFHRVPNAAYVVSAAPSYLILVVPRAGAHMVHLSLCCTPNKPHRFYLVRVPGLEGLKSHTGYQPFRALSFASALGIVHIATVVESVPHWALPWHSTRGWNGT